jgi:hypothetical protein
MTDIEILSKLDNWTINGVPFNVSTMDCLKAMNEYAKQQAIEFSAWNCKDLWSTYNGMWYPYQDEDNPITGEELYNLWLQSKTQ